MLQFLAEEEKEEEELVKVQAIYNSILFSIHSFVFISEYYIYIIGCRGRGEGFLVCFDLIVHFSLPSSIAMHWLSM